MTDALPSTDDRRQGEGLATSPAQDRPDGQSGRNTSIGDIGRIERLTLHRFAGRSRREAAIRDCNSREADPGSERRRPLLAEKDAVG